MWVRDTLLPGLLATACSGDDSTFHVQRRPRISVSYSRSVDFNKPTLLPTAWPIHALGDRLEKMGFGLIRTFLVVREAGKGRIRAKQRCLHSDIAAARLMSNLGISIGYGTRTDWR